MNNFGQNIEDKFRDAFSNYEAPHSPADMDRAWQNVSRNIPQAHIPANPATGAKIGLGAGKIAGIAATAIIAVSSLVLYFNTDHTSKNSEAIASQVQSIHATTESGKTNLIDKGRDRSTSAIDAGKNEFNANGKTVTPTSGRKYKNIRSHRATKAGNAIGNTSNYSNNVQPAASNPNSPQPKTGIRPNNSYNEREIAETTDTAICITSAYKINDISNIQKLDVEWGDGKRSLGEAARQHVYSAVGEYTINISNGISTLAKRVTVNSAPQVHFINYESKGMACKFKNTSQNAGRYVWDFGDNSGTTELAEPDHIYQDTGRFKVRLTAYNTAGCSASLMQEISVSDKNRFSIPNTFTPNGDGKNDEFDISVSGDVVYDLQIYDLSNMQQVFTSTNKDKKWDGNNYRTGKQCRIGSYIYVLKFQYPGEEMIEKTGTVTLNR
jgi:gliding motility-associated-like protein